MEDSRRHEWAEVNITRKFPANLGMYNRIWYLCRKVKTSFGINLNGGCAFVLWVFFLLERTHSDSYCWPRQRRDVETIINVVFTLTYLLHAITIKYLVNKRTIDSLKILPWHCCSQMWASKLFEVLLQYVKHG